MEFEQIQKEITTGKFRPVYYLGGDEPYFIDKLAKLLEESVLNPGEETFNKAVMYGADAKASKLLGELRSFPMLASHRLVILKEAQKLKKNEWDSLAPYLENPVGSTVFVMTFKGKDLDGRSKAYKAIQKNGIVFKAKKFYENKIPAWIQSYVSAKGYKIEPKALNILSTYLGTNLGLIESELEKIFIYLKGDKNQEINASVVYEMINVDKDFNVFELMNALGTRDHSKSHFIINQMMKNVKDNPSILILVQLFGFYSKVFRIKGKRINSEFEASKELGIPAFVARQYITAAKNYSDKDINRNLASILETDLFLKGIKNTYMAEDHLMKTLVYKLLN